MRFFTSALLALPIVGAAAQDFEQYKAKFQNFVDNFGSYIPNPNRHDHAAAAHAKVGAMKTDTLTLANWNQTLYGPIQPGSTTPVEWLLFITGGNATCLGRCGRVEAAFNETAPKLALLPDPPHVAILNCDNQPVLCNAWAAGVGSIWVFDLLPKPAEVEIYRKRLNMTTATSDDILDLYKDWKAGNREEFKLKDGAFHPFNGLLADFGLSTATGYAIWILNLIPNWAMMLGITMLSRTIMSRTMDPGAAQQRRAAAAATQAEALRRGAPPGDAANR